MFSGIDLLEKSVFTSTAVVLSYLFILFLPFVVYNFFKEWSSMNSKSIKTIWIAVAVFYLAAYALVYPGFVGYDDVNSTVIIRTGVAWGWQSLTYSFFLAVGQILFGGFGFTTAICILFFLYMCLKIFSLIDAAEVSEKKRLFLAGGLCFLALHPLNQSLLLFHCRDTLFSLLLLFLGFQIYEKHEWTALKITWFVALLVLLGDLRQEAKIYLIIFPLIFYFLKKWNARQMTTYLLSCIMLSFVYYWTLSNYFNVESYTRSYQVTAYVLPLSQIFHDKPENQISDEHKKNIGAVLDIQKLKDHFNPIDIDPFHLGGFNHFASVDEWRRFKTSAHSLILENFDIFLKNRVYLMKSMLNMGHPPITFSDDLRVSDDPELAKMKLKLNEQTHLLGKVGVTYREALKHIAYSTSVFNFILSSLFLPVLFLVASLSAFRYFPELGSLALIVSVRLPILFLLAPASYVKYVYSLFLFFTFIPVLYLMNSPLMAKKPDKP